MAKHDPLVQEITTYDTGAGCRVVEVRSPTSFVVYAPDEQDCARLKVGQLLRFEAGASARVINVLGQHRALAVTLSEVGVDVGNWVEVTEHEAAIARVSSGQREVDLRGAHFVAQEEGTLGLRARAPAFSEIDAGQRAVKTGVEAIDLLSPVVEGGLTVVVDTSAGESGYDRITAGVRGAIEPSVCMSLVRGESAVGEEITAHVRVSQGVITQQLYGLRALAGWSMTPHLTEGDQLILASVPDLEVTPDQMARFYGGQDSSKGGAATMHLNELMAWLGRTIVSTKQVKRTCVIRMKILASAMAFAEIVDALGLSGVDALVFIDERGCYDPLKSRSNAQFDDPEVQQRALRVRATLYEQEHQSDFVSIFGEDELGVDGAPEPEIARWRVQL